MDALGRGLKVGVVYGLFSVGESGFVAGLFWHQGVVDAIAGGCMHERRSS